MMLSAPHAHEGLTIRTVMFKVNFALAPAVLLGVLQFGMPTLFMLLTCIFSALICEILCLKMNPQGNGEANDGAAILTALLLAMSLPPHAPLWLAALGSMIAVVFGKQLYGGLGQNLFNPAMLARVVLLIAFPVQMTHWVEPTAFYDGQFYKMSIDGISGATTLGHFKESGKLSFDWAQHALGMSKGSMGETSALLLALGGLWLMQQKVFTWHAPVATLLGCLVPGSLHWFLSASTIATPLAQLTSGGLLLGAFFIVTDPVTSPTSNMGKIIFGLLTGFLVYVIRTFGNFPEGVAFAVLLANAATPLIDNYTRPKAYGYQASKETQS
jgi:electron transport complex protein RnfD